MVVQSSKTLVRFKVDCTLCLDTLTVEVLATGSVDIKCIHSLSAYAVCCRIQEAEGER